MARLPRLVEDSVVLVDGPWTHRVVAANGINLHLAEAGTGPLVVLLHGFPEFWWSWHHQITALVESGRRVVAVDLRGYGGSDKPPRGYDSMTLAADVVGLIRALGERSADVVGHDWGAHLAWTIAAVHPKHVRRAVAISVPHPLAWPRAILTSGGQRRASSYIGRFQLPWHPERWIVESEAVNIGELMERWGGPNFPDDETRRRCREAMLIRSAPHCSMEYYRWAVRSLPRSDGRRYRSAMRARITTPMLQLHGAVDACVLASTAARSSRFVDGPYRWTAYDGVGHFPHEELPDRVTADIIDWLSGS